MNKEKRDDRLQVLLSKTERARLNETAGRLGLQPSSYARMKIIQGVEDDANPPKRTTHNGA